MKLDMGQFLSQPSYVVAAELERTTNSSSSLEDITGWRSRPHWARDDLIANNETWEMCVHTQDEWEPWWMQDLGETRLFYGVRLFPSAGDPIVNAFILIGNKEHGNNSALHADVSVKNISHPQLFKLSPPREGRFVLLKLSRWVRKRRLVICEVQYIHQDENEIVSKQTLEESTYYFVRASKKIHWLQASKNCARDSAMLLSLNDERESSFIFRWLVRIPLEWWDNDTHHEEQQMYIGLHDISSKERGFVRGVNGFFRWTDGSPLVASRWTPGEPDGGPREQCVMLEMFRRNTDRQWQDIMCNKPYTHQYICEKNVE